MISPGRRYRHERHAWCLDETSNHRQNIFTGGGLKRPPQIFGDSVPPGMLLKILLHGSAEFLWSDPRLDHRQNGLPFVIRQLVEHLLGVVLSQQPAANGCDRGQRIGAHGAMGAVDFGKLQAKLRVGLHHDLRRHP
jgi:hypothetical protein